MASLVVCFFVFYLVCFGFGSRVLSLSLNGTVYINSLDGSYSVKFGVLDKVNGAAYGTFDDNLMSTGWGELNIVAGTGKGSYLDTEIMYAAGFLEGALTARQINDHYSNTYGIFFKNGDPLVEKVAQFFEHQDKWMRNMIVKNLNSSSSWRQMGNILAQFDGLISGYKAHPATEKPLDPFAFQVLNGIGDLLDLRNALSPESMPDWDHMTEDQILSQIFTSGHCSVLIKVLPAYENIFASHASWFSYSAMLRIYKHYNLNIKDASTGTRRMSFSSYPGILESLDDFYIMDRSRDHNPLKSSTSVKMNSRNGKSISILIRSGLILLQTTNNVFNKSLYEFVKPQSLLAWHRVRLSNLMARSGKEWANTFKLYNSGTYNNQYMILDLKLVELNRTLHDGALWVVEQIPTYVASGDQTAILRLGYWPSYNVPFYEKVYNLSGYPDFVRKHGTSYSYELAPRAKIFRRDQATVKDMETMKHIMRYNDYKHDPYSHGNPMNAICGRGDLNPTKPSAGGCYDAKVTDFFMAKSLVSFAVNGPTAQGQPPFHWSEYPFPDVHNGMPDLFNFDFATMKTRL